MTHREPWLVQISNPCCVGPLANTRAWDTVGAMTPNTATSTASHTTQWRCGWWRRSVFFINVSACAYILCLLWSMAGMSAGLPPGAMALTGTVSSVLVSTPLASLNTNVSGIVVSFCKVLFKSISMTW